MILKDWLYISKAFTLLDYLPPKTKLKLFHPAGARYSSMVRVFTHGAINRRMDRSWGGPIELFLVPASAPRLVYQRPCMCYPVCGIMHIKEPLLLIGKSSPCCGSGFPLSLSEWSFTICLMPYNRKYNVLSVSLNKTFPSFVPPSNPLHHELAL